jgi:hypothetical protein
MPRKDLTLFKIFEELLDSPEYSLLGSFDFSVMNTPWSLPKGVYKNLLVPNTQGSQESPVINALGSLDSVLNLPPKFLF